MFASSVLVGLATGASAQTVVEASYESPTTRYPHGALGDDVEHTTLRVGLSDGAQLSVTWPRPIVFEDTAPRLVDVDADGGLDILAVEAHEQFGARLSVWRVRDGSLERAASTPWIGQRFRWLAPLGAADLDGDGRIEIAYVDRPHLARILRVWRVDTFDSAEMTLTEIASAPGLTNHRLRDPKIPGGIRICNGEPEMITANADWTNVMATRLLPDAQLVSRALAPWRSGALNDALDCSF